MTQLPGPPRENQPPGASSRSKRSWLVPAGTFLIGLIIGAGIGAAGGDGQQAAAPSVASLSPVSESPLPEPSPSPSPEPAADLTRRDMELSLKTTEKQCFGSAGCNVSVQVRLTVDAAVVDALPEDGTWDITYEISGDESGPIVGTFSVYGNGKYDVNEEFLSTPSGNTPVRVKILSVERFT